MTDDFPEPVEEVEKIEPEKLKEKIENGENMLLLDVRAESEHEEWTIDAGEGEIINEPYFELLEGLPKDFKEELRGEDREVIVICAKGGSSEYIASMIKEDLGLDIKNLKEGMNGWAEIYEKQTHQLGDGKLIQYMRPSSGCLAYMVKSQGEAAIIDPLRTFSDEYIEESEELKYAIDTHIHADHVSGVRRLGESEETTPVIPEAVRERGVTYIDDVKTVGDGETLQVGDIEIKAIHTPGHTTGMTSYLINEEVLATGDGLFVESVARPDLEKGDDGAPRQAGQLYETLQEKILTLDDDIYIAPGHFSDSAEKTDGAYMRKIGELKKEMDPLSYGGEEFVDFILEDMPPRPSNYRDVIATNLGKQEATDKEAFEMELGPNNCAATQDSMA
ncbi:MAG: glyoxylase-like metal-dependent hydrolase (beta-lactamase superfamily II) [Candidatus Nanohaloarchaea archaeon]|jgi:glyoxylase-like metal-dependent hydrolase (beta-lactamase superfamily II)